MNQPLFSIITITYNAAKELTPTLQSVKEQTFQDFEHLLIDGASTDDTLSIARKEGVKTLRIVSEPDNGLYDAMNKGLHLSRGKYVIFLNAGDTFASPLVLDKYAEAAAEKDVDIIYGDTVIVDDKRRIMRPRHHSAPELLTRDSFSHGMLICHQAFCMRRELAPDYDINYRFSADYDWTIRCIEATSPQKCRNLNTIVIHYLDNGMTEKNKRASLLERYEIMKKHYGLSTAIRRHLEFIPRALTRKLSR
ncbi:MAG: glycosyltransferase [Muribaculaceae bacterium]|nr:glycosyltransferase [Muribaculaceae bacterium]